MRSLLFSVLLLALFQCYGQQVHRTFINKKGEVVDSASANTYILSRLVGDSLWVSKSYDMKNNLVMTGTFIDEALTIPHGLFKYYLKQEIYVNGNNDTISRDSTIFLRQAGQFDNGKRTGKWVEYFNTGKPETICTFVRDTLNGPYIIYNHNSVGIYLKGNFINGLREGEWDIFGYDNEFHTRDFYKKGKLITNLWFPSSYVPPVRPVKVDIYLKKNLVKFLLPKYQLKEVLIDVWISAEGKITDCRLEVMYPIAENHFKSFQTRELAADNKLLSSIPEIKKIFLDCPVLFIPAYDKRSNKKLPGDMEFILYVQKESLKIFR